MGGGSEKRLVAVWRVVSLHHKRIRSVLQLGLMWVVELTSLTVGMTCLYRSSVALQN
jgi:hypothetical protein